MITNNNYISAPMRSVDFDLRYTSEPGPRQHFFRYLEQDFYDAMTTHDLNTIYICRNDEDDYNIYLGDQLLKHETVSITGPKFVVGLDDKLNFVVYSQVYDTFTNCIRLEEICRFDNPDDAIEKLYYYNRVGDYTDEALKAYIAIVTYIKKEIGINEVIISMIANIGNYRDDPRLQYLNERAIAYGVTPGSRDLSTRLKGELRKKLINNDDIFTLYADIYDVFVMYDFFTDLKKYDVDKFGDDGLDLAEPVKRILACFNGSSNSTNGMSSYSSETSSNCTC